MNINKYTIKLILNLILFEFLLFFDLKFFIILLLLLLFIIKRKFLFFFYNFL